MCYNHCDGEKLKKLVDWLWSHDRERWAIIENKSGQLECVPEKSLKLIPDQKIYYQLKTQTNE